MLLRLVQNLARKLKPSSALHELSLFLNKDGPVWLTVKSLTRNLNEEKINYAIICGLAVYQHGYERTTRDCDILLSKTVNTLLSMNKYLSECDYFLFRIMRSL